MIYLELCLPAVSSDTVASLSCNRQEGCCSNKSIAMLVVGWFTWALSVVAAGSDKWLIGSELGMAGALGNCSDVERGSSRAVDWCALCELWHGERKKRHRSTLTMSCPRKDVNSQSQLNEDGAGTAWGSVYGTRSNPRHLNLPGRYRRVALSHLLSAARAQNPSKFSHMHTRGCQKRPQLPFVCLLSVKLPLRLLRPNPQLTSLGVKTYISYIPDPYETKGFLSLNAFNFLFAVRISIFVAQWTATAHFCFAMVSLTMVSTARIASTGRCLSTKSLGETTRVLLILSAFYQLVAFSLAASYFTAERIRASPDIYGKALNSF